MRLGKALFARLPILLAILPLALNIGSASAGMILDLQGGSVVIADNGAGDTDAALGRIVNTSIVAGFGISITVATSNSPGGPVGLLQIQSLDIQNLNAAPASLLINLSDVGFTLPGGAGSPMLLESAVGGTFTFSALGDSMTFQSFADPANAQPASAIGTAPLTFLKGNPLQTTEAFSGSNSIGFVRGAGPYSLANATLVTLSPGAQMNFSGTSTASVVPEPASVLLLSGFSLLMLCRRR